MGAKAGDSTHSRSPSQIELCETFSHAEVNQASPSSSEDFEVASGLSRGSSKDQHQEQATLIDIVTPIDYNHQQPGFSFRELARFFGPGLLTCVAYVVRNLPPTTYVNTTKAA